MVARMVRDHKVVGSNPVASTIFRRTAFAVLRNVFNERFSGFEVRQEKLVFRRTADSNAVLTAIGFCYQAYAKGKPFGRCPVQLQIFISSSYNLWYCGLA